MRPEKLWYLSTRLHRAGLTPLARLLKAVNFQLFGAILPYQVDLAPDVVLWHRGLATVIHPSTTIKRGVRIAHHVTIGGGDSQPDGEHRVTIEEGAVLTTGCSVIPKEGTSLRIGSGAIIGAHAVITRDVPDGAVMVGPKAHRLT